MNQPLVMGILNATPDSFSDFHIGLDEGLRHAELMIEEGADIIDVGGESTRPGAGPVAVNEELERTIPILEAIRRRFPVRLSIDTRKYDVATAAVAAGATIINDVTGGSDVRMAELAARTGVDYILMHMQGTPETMQRSPEYPRGVVTEVREALAERAKRFCEAGVPAEHIWIDPGIGFGKTLEHNLELLRRLDELSGVGSRIVIGTSRKSFLARALGDADLPFASREAGTLASNLWALGKGATVFRVHEVGQMKRALRTWEAICG